VVVSLKIQRPGHEKETCSVDSDESVLVKWPGRPLESRSSAIVSVRVRGHDRVWSSWANIQLETGLLARTDWMASTITSRATTVDHGQRPYRMRATFTLQKWDRARLYITAFGCYEASINGKRVGNQILAPGWTSYNDRLPYQTYDVTDLLQCGDNILGAWVAEGWYAGVLGFGGGRRNNFGNRPALVAQLEIDGQTTICTGSDWNWSEGALVESSLYHGETYDASLPDVDFETGVWEAVDVLPLLSPDLFASQSPPVQEVATIKPVEIITTPSGKVVFDFGQNCAGVIRILSEPPVGSEELVFRHAEVLENGELGTRPLRHARATDRVTLSNSSIKGYMPKFTFHGFRYAEITGWLGICLGDLEAVVLQSSMKRIGNFSCSHDSINKLYNNSLWSAIGNTISVPTDCPQRDERLGWTGDLCVFSPTMSYMFDTAGFVGEWLKDLALDQKRCKGVVPLFVPVTQPEFAVPQAIWGDTATITPYDLFQATGDLATLARQYDSGELWLQQGVRRDSQTGLWNRSEDHLADWLSPKASPHVPNLGPTDNLLVADAWLIHSTRTLAEAARILGKADESNRLNNNADDMVAAFYKEYVTSTGRIISDSQTAYCLLLRYKIYPRATSVDYQKQFASRLVELVRRANWQIDTGFAGTPIILQSLVDTGNVDHAYRMLQAKTSPSWLSCVLLGATTIWERWDSMLPDGSINPGEMTSFNHYALGSVAHFMHEHIGGLSPLEPGWKRILVKPRPGGTVSSAVTSHFSPYGQVSCEWAIVNSILEATIIIPPNTTAVVVLPGLCETVGSGEHHFRVAFEQPTFPPEGFNFRFTAPLPNEWIR
jgi:alpha-L-rhamnosidase